MMMPVTLPPPKADRPVSAELIASEGPKFALTGAALSGTASGGIARLVLEQRFENTFQEPIAITYRMPLPENGVVSAYSFKMGARRIHGEIDTKEKARTRFVEAISEGRTAALLEENRANIFTQEIGNVPPGETLFAEIVIEQRLDFTPEGDWELRFPTVIGPRYISVRDSEDVARDVAIRVADGPLPFRVNLAVQVQDAVADGGSITSPSHSVRVANGTVTLADKEGARLDRDIVLRWAVAKNAVGVTVAAARPGSARPHANAAYGLLTLTPPAPSMRTEALPRDLIVLFDTSGSMSGAPLEKAKHAVSALIDGLGTNDRFELIEFSDQARRYAAEPTFSRPEEKKAALAWIRSLRASSSTEMYSALKEALSSLREGAQRQVVLITDGYVGGEHEIVQLLHERFPKGCRLHVIAVGSAVNRALSGPLARAGRGIEIVIGLEEDVERRVHYLSSRLVSPILTDVRVEGDVLLEHAPEAIPDVFQGAPLLVAVKLKPEGGSLTLRAESAAGEWTTTVTVPKTAAGEGNPAIVSLFARECVQDLETRWVLGKDVERIDRDIERIGLVFQIATRKTSFVAVDEVRSVDGASQRHETIPQELPYGTKMEGFGLGAAASMVTTRAGTISGGAKNAVRAMMAPAAPPPASRSAPMVPMGAIAQKRRSAAKSEERAAAVEEEEDDMSAPAPTTPPKPEAPIAEGAIAPSFAARVPSESKRAPKAESKESAAVPSVPRPSAGARPDVAPPRGRDLKARWVTALLLLLLLALIYAALRHFGVPGK